MSGWRIAVKSLHRGGGGPLRAVEFDCDRPSLRRAKELGLVWFINGSHWQLTAKGRAFAEGRIGDVYRSASGQGSRGVQFVSTWLNSLPRPNAIRLSGGVAVEYQ